MNFKKKLSLASLVALASCGYPEPTASRVTAKSDQKQSEESQSSKILNLVPSYPTVEDSEVNLTTAMNAVNQIQITKPVCPVETNEMTGTSFIRTPIQSQTSYCLGTVITYNNRAYVITAAHCIASTCTNLNSLKPTRVSPPVVGLTYNETPQLSGIKFPLQPNRAEKASPTDTKSAFPLMDTYPWEDSTKVLTASAVEFVSGSSAIGNYYTGITGRPASQPTAVTNMCGSAGQQGTSGQYVQEGSMDVAVIDFGLRLAQNYPMLKLPAVAFNTSKFMRTGYQYQGVSMSNTSTGDPSDIWRHFQKVHKPANQAACRAYVPVGTNVPVGSNSLGAAIPFLGGSNYQDAFVMTLGIGGCSGDSGGPMFEEVGAPGAYTYELAGIASLKAAMPNSMSLNKYEKCAKNAYVTYTSINPGYIISAINRINIANYPKNVPNVPPCSEDTCIATSISAPTTVTNSTTVLWKALTKSDGVTKVAAQVAGQPLMAIATDGLGQRKATWKAPTLSFGYYKVDIQFPKNIQNASCLVAQFETNPLRVATKLSSKIVTILMEGTAAYPKGAYSGNEIAVGDPVRGPGIPAGATVAIAPASRTSSTFTMSVAATATSVATGTPLILTSTFRNRVDQKMIGTMEVNIFQNVTLNLLPFTRTSIGNKNEFYIWVPPLANTISPGSLTLIMHDKGCGTAAAPAGRMTADTVIFALQSPLK